MSSTALLKVPISGTLECFKEYKNSHGSAPVIWDTLVKKYLHQESWVSVMDKLWPLARDEKVSVADRYLLALTFDNMILEKELFDLTITRLRAFGDEYRRNNPTHANHLNALADDLELLKADETCSGAAFIWTSVAADCWENPDYDEDDEEADGDSMYNISKNTGHWFLGTEFPELKENV